MQAKVIQLLAFLVFISGCLAPETGTTTKSNLTTGGGGSSGGSGSAPPPPAPAGSGNIAPEGRVNGIDATSGIVSGWVYDQNTLNQSVTVEFYFDGPVGSVQMAAGSPVVANVQRAFTPVGPYGYSYNIPQQYKDGKQHLLYVYGLDTTNGTRSLLKISDFASGPSSFFVGSTAAGMSYYNSTVQPSLASACGNCHGPNYIVDKARMALPSKFSGGSGTNNNLYRKGMGLDGHGAGNRCGSGPPCTLINTWWGLEFN